MQNKKKIVSIHQSQYLPWSPYIKKIALSDVFVVLDDIQFQKNGVQNRNKIRNKNGDFWITLPVNNKLQENIKDKIIIDSKTIYKHWKMIEQSYVKSRNWLIYRDELLEIYSREYQKIYSLNMDLLKFFMKVLQIKTEIVESSSLGLKSKKSELVLDICKKMDSNIYLSGLGSKGYLDEQSFSSNNIEIKYLESIAPEYNQIYLPFIPNLSILDFILNGTEEEIKNYFMREKLEDI